MLSRLSIINDFQHVLKTFSAMLCLRCGMLLFDCWRPLLCARLPPLDIVKGNAHMLSFGFSCDCSSYIFFLSAAAAEQKR